MYNNQIPVKFFYVLGNATDTYIQIEAPMRGISFKGVEMIKMGCPNRVLVIIVQDKYIGHKSYLLSETEFRCRVPMVSISIG